MNTTSRERFLAYLHAYAAKDLATIEAMLADDVALRDWKISVRGKAAALAETATNFANARSIVIEPLRVTADATRVAGELRIVVDDMHELFVVDVIDFDGEGRITAIRAYLGRSD